MTNFHMRSTTHPFWMVCAIFLIHLYVIPSPYMIWTVEYLVLYYDGFLTNILVPSPMIWYFHEHLDGQKRKGTTTRCRSGYKTRFNFRNWLIKMAAGLSLIDQAVTHRLGSSSALTNQRYPRYLHRFPRLPKACQQPPNQPHQSRSIYQYQSCFPKSGWDKRSSSILTPETAA